jgi:hypothetical protein
MVYRGRSGGASRTHAGADRGHGGALTRAWPPGAPLHQSSPAGAQKGERSTGSSARASPELGRRWVDGGDRRKWLGSVSMVGKTQLTCEALLTERRGRGGWLGRARTKKENVFPAKTRPTRGLDGPSGRFRPTGTARPVDWLGQRPSGPQGWPGRKQGKRISELKLDF